MLKSRRNFCNKHILLVTVIYFLCFLFLCEYLIYYMDIGQCLWPTLDLKMADNETSLSSKKERPVRAMFVTDTHLLGSKKSYLYDILLRDWQMRRTFQTAISLHKPEVVFVLGDLFDEGLCSSSEEFESYLNRFHNVFRVANNTEFYVLAGNHDMGFHDEISPYMNKRFINGLKAPNVRRISIRGNHFVLINSMGLQGDGCFLCKPTEVAVKNISNQLKCAKGIGIDCPKNGSVEHYSRPILLQHFPMYRESDVMCHEKDQATGDEKTEMFHEKLDCLSKEASEQLLDILQPRLIVDGHTHHGCRRYHRDGILELTIPSFNLRNKDNPSFLLMVLTPNNYALYKCYMPVQSFMLKIYAVGVLCYCIYLIFKCHRCRKPKRLLIQWQ